MKYVIIGNSTAAVGCVEGIRQVDKEGSITILASEPHHVYSRPLISYLLYGKTDEQRMKYRPDSFYEDNNVTALLGKTAVSIDKEQKIVVLDDGQRIPYDKLLLATGSKPFIPPMKGLDNVEKKTTFMSLDDAKRLAAMLTPDSKVLIIGAGLIGLKCMEGIHHMVKNITIIDLADRILPSILDETGSAMIQSYLEQKGIQFILGTSASELTAHSATLKDGTVLDFDVLVVAVGVRPNLELAQEIGAKTGRAIEINSKSETSIPDVYAAGDCCECYDIAADVVRVLAILPNAYQQGEAAGINMAGGSREFNKAIPMNAIGFFDYHIITAGSYDGEAHIAKSDHTYKKLVTKDNRLIGYILIGEIERAGIYTSLIREKTPLDTIDFDLIFEHPQLMAFSKTERAKKLGGAKL